MPWKRHPSLKRASTQRSVEYDCTSMTSGRFPEHISRFIRDKDASFIEFSAEAWVRNFVSVSPPPNIVVILYKIKPVAGKCQYSST